MLTRLLELKEASWPRGNRPRTISPELFGGDGNLRTPPALRDATVHALYLSIDSIYPTLFVQPLQALLYGLHGWP